MATQFRNSEVIWLDCVDSTNEEVKRRILEFSKPTWIIAKKQSKGKGRNGNSWVSSNGNFSGSMIFFPTIERSYFHLYSFFFGVALFNTIKKLINDEVDIRLKWPNDLMIEDGKVAGILRESIDINNKNSVGLIVGVGVNLNSSPSLKNCNVRRYDAQHISNFTNSKIDQLSFLSNFNDELIGLGSYFQEQNLSSILNF